MSDDPALFAEPIIAYRVWRVLDLVEEAPDLRSLIFSHHIWPIEAPLEAKCACTKAYAHTYYGPQARRVSHSDPPHVDSACGIYAFRNFTQMFRNPSYPGGSERTGTFLRGAVALWGRVIEAERGYRAELARPLAFLQETERAWPTGVKTWSDEKHRGAQDERLHLVAERYQLPVLPADLLPTYAETFGRPL